MDDVERTRRSGVSGTVVDTSSTVDRRFGRDACSHTAQTRAVLPSSPGCEDCLAAGERWVHLRLCLTCGRVGCCDSSPRRHATEHQHQTDHPIVTSAEPGEDWSWCYPDQLLLEPADDPASSGVAHLAADG